MTAVTEKTLDRTGTKDGTIDIPRCSEPLNWVVPFIGTLIILEKSQEINAEALDEDQLSRWCNLLERVLSEWSVNFHDGNLYIAVETSPAKTHFFLSELLFRLSQSCSLTRHLLFQNTWEQIFTNFSKLPLNTITPILMLTSTLSVGVQPARNLNHHHGPIVDRSDTTLDLVIISSVLAHIIPAIQHPRR